MAVKRILKKTTPWIITAAALYLAFKDVNWPVLFAHLGSADVRLLSCAFAMTALSYLFRGRRWMHLFPECKMNFPDSTRVLTLGFFFNNVLPARAGEFVRAHLGAQITGQSRALLLATIASERLIDGLTISLLFVLFAFGIGDHVLSQRLFYVALGFAAIAFAVVLTIAFRRPIFSAVRRLERISGSKHFGYVLEKLSYFIEGLSPLCTWNKLPLLVLWSVVIWWNELFVFYLISHAYGAYLTLAQTVLMMVAVNFSSLIPSAPGGIGVIEAIASAALVSIGVPRELALSMILTQHVIQYAVVCIPGALMTLTWKNRLERIRLEALAES